MTRLSGIQLLAASFVLWTLAVWIFGTPAPAGNGTETEATARANSEKTEAPGTGTTEPAGSEAAADPAVPEHQVPATPSDSEMATGGTMSRVPSERTSAVAVPTPPPVGAPTAPAAGVQPPADPARAAETAISAPASGADTLAAIPTPPGDFATGWSGDGMGRLRPQPGAAPPPSWIEPPLSRPALPPRPGHRAADHDPVAAQLDAGRRATWEGRFADALAHYRAAARLRPDHYVVWGEMGNVLWTMRRWPEAAYALEGAATLLVRAGELRAASELVPAVRRIDPDAAHRIQQRVWAAAQRQSG